MTTDQVFLSLTMAPKSKSLFRQPGAQHFQLVHRSQRDPLIHDPEASQHVLKQFVRQNDRKVNFFIHNLSLIDRYVQGKSRAQLETSLDPSEVAHDLARGNLGEASLYGIYYDDTEYDYMQHLRAVGVHEDGVESTLIEAPAPRRQTRKDKDNSLITIRDLPPEALPSTSELPRNYESQQAIPSSIAGLQPDMDAHLRQTLEALEDDAFVDDDIEDDFFDELVRDGERDPKEKFVFEFAEEGLDDLDAAAAGTSYEATEGPLNDDTSWEARFAAFKKKQRREGMEDDASDTNGYDSEGADTVGRMPEFSVIGGKKRRKGGSDASGYSMTSSSMFRTEGLQLLDERFEHVHLSFSKSRFKLLIFLQFEKEYDEEADEEIPDDSDSDDAPELITSRDDFDALMNDFLENYEIYGGKMKPALEGTGTEKLERLRLAMGRDERIREGTSDESNEDDEDIYAELEREDKRERWDVETVLSEQAPFTRF
jgi:protein LTV1